MKHYFLVAKDVGDLTAIVCAALEEKQAKPTQAFDRFLSRLRRRPRAVDEDGAPLIDRILDVAGQKGTGKWTCESALDLGSQFDLHFFCIDALVLFPVMMEVSILIHQARHFVGRRDRSPAVINSFARQREMQPKVGIGMRFRVVGNLWKPRARHHQARGIDSPARKSLYGRGVDRVGFAQVVGMDNDQLCARRIAQALCQSLRSDRGRQSSKENTEKQNSKNGRRNHR